MSLNHKIDLDHLLNELLSTQLSDNDQSELHDYIMNSFDDHELEKLMLDHWVGLEHTDVAVEEMQLGIIKDRIHSKIQIREKTSGNKIRLIDPKWTKVLIRIAATLFIPLLLSFMFFYHNVNKKLELINISTSTIQQVSANPGSRVHFYLPDQTEVWLNSESKLEYSSDFYKHNQRKVKLYGQGYFKVAPDAEHPFLVKTDKLKIKVLGTSFDVSSYTDDNEIISTLVEGSIVLLGIHGKELAHLRPGQKAILDKRNNVLRIEQVETRLTTSWIDGKLIFRNTSLIQVTKQLERWFNCKIHVDPELLDSQLYYTATIKDETLGEVLQMIEISTLVETKIKGREVHISKKK